MLVIALCAALAAVGVVIIVRHTTVLLTPEEIDEAAKRSVDYRAPGS